MVYPKIQRVQVFDDYSLEILFDDGSIKVCDFKSFFKKGLFFQLRDLKFFKKVEITYGGESIVWEDGIEISKEDLWEYGKKIVIN